MPVVSWQSYTISENGVETKQPSLFQWYIRTRSSAWMGIRNNYAVTVRDRRLLLVAGDSWVYTAFAGDSHVHTARIREHSQLQGQKNILERRHDHYTSSSCHKNKQLWYSALALQQRQKFPSPQWDRLLPGIIAHEYRLCPWAWSEKEITYCFVSSVNRNISNFCVGERNYFWTPASVISLHNWQNCIQLLSLKKGFNALT
jgi:hypothetical protein